jgi:hypothetical protein
VAYGKNPGSPRCELSDLQRHSVLKRDVVLKVVHAGTAGSWRRFGGGRAGTARARLIFGAATAFATTQHLHGVGPDLGGIAILTILALPLAGFQRSLDVNLRSFFKVLACDLGQFAEEDDAVPLGSFALFPVDLSFQLSVVARRMLVIWSPLGA